MFSLFCPQLDDVDQLSHLFWLPVRMPARVRCVLSFKQGSAATSFKMAIAQALHLEISPLEKMQQEEMVSAFFGSYNKVSNITRQTSHSPPGNHHVSHLYKCPILRL